ncbi:MAG: hypothetical protein IJV96_08025 [Clostridia bacterium]|nr:hypothetical protein [Clostridia bacterium]
MSELFFKQIHIAIPILLSLLPFCALTFLLIGVLVKARVISFDQVLAADQYLLAAVLSTVIFLLLPLPTALLVWSGAYLLMHLVFFKNRELLAHIARFDQNKPFLREEQEKTLAKAKNYIPCAHALLWHKDFGNIRRECFAVIKACKETPQIAYRRRPLPFSLFATGTIGLSLSFCAYGAVMEEPTQLWQILLENYAILACILFALYFFMYFCCMQRAQSKTWFYISFAIASTVGCATVAYISFL